MYKQLIYAILFQYFPSIHGFERRQNNYILLGIFINLNEICELVTLSLILMHPKNLIVI